MLRTTHYTISSHLRTPRDRYYIQPLIRLLVSYMDPAVPELAVDRRRPALDSWYHVRSPRLGPIGEVRDLAPHITGHDVIVAD